jgi:hypothetical protein
VSITVFKPAIRRGRKVGIARILGHIDGSNILLACYDIIATRRKETANIQKSAEVEEGIKNIVHHPKPNQTLPFSQNRSSALTIPILITNSPPPLRLTRPTPFDLVPTRLRTPQALLTKFPAEGLGDGSNGCVCVPGVVSAVGLFAGQFGYDVSLAFGAGDGYQGCAGGSVFFFFGGEGSEGGVRGAS